MGHPDAHAMRLVHIFSISLSCFCIDAAHAEPMLKIGEKSYVASELLKRPEIETITVQRDPAYGGREMRYKAIPAAALFAETNLREDEVVQVRCLDGFVASISKERILQNGPGRSIAYLA